MNAKSEGSVLSGLLKQGYQKVFFENWPIWLGGLLIGIMSVITFAWAKPWALPAGS